MQRQARLYQLAPAAMGLVLLGTLCACAGGSKPVLPKVESEKETPRPAPAEETALPAEAAAAPSVPPASPEAGKSPNTTTIEIGGDEAAKKRPVSLLEASRAEKERRAKAPRPMAVITNKTLSQYNKGQLTIIDPKSAPKAAETPPPSAPGVRGEEYWKIRGLDIRTRWREAADRVKELEQAAADWRRRFYGESDATTRDLKIKPEWDRTLDELRQSRLTVEETKKDLEQFLEEGRQAGALPGWLREGIDKEPATEPPPPKPTDAIEPPIIPIDGRNG